MSIYFDNYIDEEGNVDEKLTLNSNGFACLTEDIESLVDKYTGVEDSSFGECAEIREDIMSLIHSIINNKCDIEGYEIPYTGGDSALSPDDLEELS
jgi:hypothetical protein|tara:strand:+ start:454 stop:741 length:288 start_codon:yes stop_codon:yes gene_type:complete